MNPDELLQQIRDLLDQYLALGGDTPVAPEAQQLADAIDQATGGGQPPADAGVLPDAGSPPGMGLEPETPPENQMEGGQEEPGDLTEPPPNPGAKTYADANVSALERLRKRNQKSRA